MFNDSAHSKRNHKRNFPSFSFQFPNTISHVIFLIYYLFLFHRGERMASASKRRKNLFIFEEFFYSFAGYQTIIKFIFRNTHILCVWKSYKIYFFHWNSFVSLFFSNFLYVSLVCFFLLFFFVGGSAIFSWKILLCLFLSSLFAAVELVCILTWWVFGFQDSTSLIFVALVSIHKISQL